MSIGEGAFSDCFRVTNLVIPNNVTNIGRRAFWACNGVTSVTLPDSVTSIGDRAFSDCNGLTNVRLGSNVTSIGTAAFAHCRNLGSITVELVNPCYRSVDGVLFNGTQSTLIQYPAGKAGSFVIPKGVTTIGAYAFAGCSGLSNVTVPSTVTNIEKSAFSYCSSLANVTFPSGVISIGDDVFSWCRNLISVTFPSTLALLGNNVFYCCSSLQGIYFYGNAPPCSWINSYAPDDLPVCYYLPGTTGWGGIFARCPTMLWNPQVDASKSVFGVGTNGFGFTITGTTNIPVLVEACTNLSSPTWEPLQSLTLTNGSIYFGDPQWTNSPGRFYRLRSP